MILPDPPPALLPGTHTSLPIAPLCQKDTGPGPGPGPHPHPHPGVFTAPSPPTRYRPFKWTTLPLADPWEPGEPAVLDPVTRGRPRRQILKVCFSRPFNELHPELYQLTTERADFPGGFASGHFPILCQISALSTIKNRYCLLILKKWWFLTMQSDQTLSNWQLFCEVS